MLTCQRHLFSLPKGTHYLNCGYMSPLPKKVEEAGHAGVAQKRVPSDIGPEDFFRGLDQIRDRFARLVKVADSDHIAVIPSASYGIATAARNLPVSGSQNIVVTAAQFPSNVYVWRRMAGESGAELRTIAPSAGEPRQGEAWNGRLLDAIDESTALVALGQVHWTDGTLFDLTAVGDRAREVGAALVVDGTQSVGALPFDAGELQPDALVCAGYKWLMGPYSLGVAYFGPRFEGGVPLEETWIARVGSDDFPRLVDYQDRYRPGAARFEPGEISNFVLVPMLNAALELIEDWGVAEIQAYCRSLTDPLVDKAAELGFGAEEACWRAGHMVGLRMAEGVQPQVLQARLAANRIQVSVRGDVLRVSPHVYNDMSDISSLVSALGKPSESSAAP
jgi:selenocysteine lyase/cysteine desulfurase